MPILRAAKRAFGAPGIAPRWTQSAKDAIGTAYSAGSTVWFTVSAGILNEVYYPTPADPGPPVPHHSSHSLLLAHEDKTYPGAMIASLSIPWGEVKGDEDLGGYHLVWTRDMVSSATGLLASGNTETPLRALIYLACSQQPDGGFHQNFWIDGEPYWRGIQLEDTASTPTALGIEFVDVPIARLQAPPIRFTFFWPAAERWEGRDFAITVEKSPE